MWAYVIGAPVVAAALVWLWREQEGAPAWERAATSAIGVALGIVVGIWMH